MPLAAGQTVYAFADENVIASGSSFRIEVNRCDREQEPNGTPTAAGPVACGLEGTISPAGEADFFRLGTLPSGSRVFALVDGIAANAASSGNDFDLRVTTDTGTLEYDDRDNTAPFADLAPNVAGTPLTGVPAYLRVSHFNSLRTAEPYRLYRCSV